MQNNHLKSTEYNLVNITSLIYFVIMVVFVLIFTIYQIFNTTNSLIPWPETKVNGEEISTTQMYSKETGTFWEAPDTESIKGSGLESQILYGKDLISHTSKYLGPKGTVMQISNGMNCQNCHLEAGSKIFGNNYGSVSSTFPKFRARSGTEESIYKRVNDCIERSLNGTPLDTLGTEMQAIKAYMLFLGKNVEKGVVVKGSGLKNIPYLDRAADPVKGNEIYNAKCVSCHQKDGNGVMATSGDEYTYPPMWGEHAYNDAAGLYRLSNFAKYVKYNMPLGATFDAPQLSDEEAWDLAAFVNSQPRPHKNTPDDWPDISKKPIDHPLGPYIDEFNGKQHKYGPFKPIAEARKDSK